jgi:hypothetical protein
MQRYCLAKGTREAILHALPRCTRANRETANQTTILSVSTF